MIPAAPFGRDVIASILGDTGSSPQAGAPADDKCRFSAISALTTVASVVFDPARGMVYVATGRPPVCNRPYVAFDLEARD